MAVVIDLGAVGDDAKQEFALGDELLVGVGGGLGRPAMPPSPSEISSRSRSPGTTCRRNFASFTPRR